MISQDFEVNDLMSFDQSLSSSFTYIKNNVLDQNELGMNFTVQDKDDGNFELVKDGNHIIVNNYTKHAYISLFLEYHGFHKASRQINTFLSGLYEVIPKKIFNLLTVEDLRKLLEGVSEINIDDWKAYTLYTGNNSSENHPAVRSFWNIISKLDQKHLK